MSAWGIIECITNVRCDYYCFSASRSSTNVGFYSLSIARSGLVVAVYIYMYRCCVKHNGVYVHASVWCLCVCMYVCVCVCAHVQLQMGGGGGGGGRKRAKRMLIYADITYNVYDNPKLLGFFS